MPAPQWAIWVGAYLLGCVPFGVLVGRLAGGDPRRHGSGNIGATNVARMGGWFAGIVTLALDTGKGALAVWAAGRLSSEPAAAPVAAACVVFGHVFPIFLRLRGGKGVATAAGAFSVLAPMAFLGAIAVFLLLVAASRTVSLGSVGAALALPLLCAWVSPGPLRVEVSALCALLVVIRHAGNLRRLAAGEEPRLGGGRCVL